MNGSLRTLIVMAKPPLMGRAKTRLAAGIGEVRAARVYRDATRRVLTRLQDPRWRMVLCVNAGPGDRFACWPKDTPRLAQGEGSLGDRMARAFAAAPPGPVLVIGTDSPQADRADVAAAFAKLGSADAVFGPSDDGGYWLIGLARRRPAPRLFEGVRWSTEHALSDTEKSLPKSFRAKRTRTLLDIDDEDDLVCLYAERGPIRFGPWPRRA